MSSLPMAVMAKVGANRNVATIGRPRPNPVSQSYCALQERLVDGAAVMKIANDATTAIKAARANASIHLRWRSVTTDATSVSVATMQKAARYHAPGWRVEVDSALDKQATLATPRAASQGTHRSHGKERRNFSKALWVGVTALVQE